MPERDPAMDDTDQNLRRRRARVAHAAVQAARAHGVLAVDELRVRPRHRDGQLLGADALAADQRLFGQRQRDFAGVFDRGVIAGLEVTQPLLPDEDEVEEARLDPLKLELGPGHGLTRTGSTLVVRERVEIDLTQFPIFEQLDGSLDLDRRPRAPARTQSGVFALTLRPVEYTANPVAPYPREITGERRLEDGDVIEACAVTLVPVASESSLDGVDAGPAALARRVFVEGLDPLLADDALPLAIVALERGRIAWLDVELARRQCLADPARGLGAGPRALREAHQRHFSRRMAKILERRASEGSGQRFAASDYFEVLPPTGTIPTQAVAVAGDRIVQWFFPANVECEVVLVPEDELAELVDEAMLMPAFDLRQSAEQAEASPVVLAIAVPREDFPEWSHATSGVLHRPIGPRLGSYARRRPIEALIDRARKPALLSGGPTIAELVPWETALAQAQSLVFFRQRRRARSSFALARYGPVPVEQRPSSSLPPAIRARIEAAGELERFDRLLATAPTEALEGLELLLARPIFAAQAVLINACVAELSSRTRRRILEPGTVTVGGASIAVAGVPAGAPAPLRVRPLTLEDVDIVVARFDGDPELGLGIAALRAFEPDLNALAQRLVIAQTLRVPELDRRTRALAPEFHEQRAAELLALAVANDVYGIRDLVGYVRPEPPPLSTPLYSNGSASSGFEHAQAVGQAALFAIIWRHADDTLRERLDQFFADARTRLGLVASVVLMGLLRLAWQCSLESAKDVDLLIERVYRWPFAPDSDFELPVLSAHPRLELTASNPRLTGFLNAMANAAGQLADPAFNFPAAQVAFDGEGFPPESMAAVDAYRVLGCAFGSVDLMITVGGVHAFLPAEFSDFVAAMREAVAARDLELMQTVHDEWRDRL